MLKIGIIGIGDIANTYIKLIANGQINAKLTAISSRNVENSTNVINKYNLQNVEIFTDYKKLLTSNLVDAVIICTPHKSHLEIAKECLINGVHTLIEKPISTDLNEALDFLEFKKDYPEIICGVSYCNRTANGFSTVKKMVDDGAVGKIKRCNFITTNYYRTQAYHDSAPWRGTFEAEGGGVLMTQASHPLDILLWICSMPKRLSGFCYEGKNRGIEVENDVHIQMEFENGSTAQFTTSSHELPGTNRLEITGEKGRVVLDNSYDLTYNLFSEIEPTYAQIEKSWFNNMKITTEKIDIETETTEQIQAKLINNFVCSVGLKTAPICSVEQAINSIKIIMATYKSSELRTMIDIN